MPPFPMPEIAAIGDFRSFLDIVRLRDTGGVVFYNHATKGGPLAIAKVMATMCPPEMPVMFPVSLHNKNGVLDWVVDRSNGHFQYLVTQATREKYQKKGRELPTLKEAAAMLSEYKQVAADTIKAGGIVVVDPQATRTATLQTPQEPVVSVLLKGLKGKGVPLDVVTGICVGVASHNGKNDTSKGGIRPFERLDMRFGEHFTLNEIPDQDFVMNRLGLLVPSEMQGAYKSVGEPVSDRKPTKPSRTAIFRRQN